MKIGIGGEIQLTDAIQNVLLSGEKVFAYKIQGVRYDIGLPAGWLKANIGLALQHPTYAPIVQKFLPMPRTSYDMIPVALRVFSLAMIFI